MSAGDAESVRVREAMQRAGALFRQRQWAEAEQLCRWVLGVKDSHLEALSLLGIIAAETQRTQEAAELLTRVAQASPGDALAHFNCGYLHGTLGRHEEALASYDRALAIRPELAEAYNNRGNSLHALRRPAEALGSYDSALRIKPGLAQAHYNRGNALRDLRRLQEALESYGRALELKPDYAQAHNDRGLLLQELGRPEEALGSYDRALAIHPESAEAHNNRGNVLKELHRFDEALASYDRALAIRPDFAGAHSNRGVLLYSLRNLPAANGEYDRAKRIRAALDSFDRAVAIHPEFAEAHSNRGNVLKDLHRFDEALASYDRALALKPDYAEAWNNRGGLLYELRDIPDAGGEYDRASRMRAALDSFDRALTIHPKFAEAHSNRGNVLKGLHRFDEALASYDRAVALKPDFAEAYNGRGVLFYDRRDIPAARADYDRAINLRADYAAAFIHRAYAALMAGDYAQGWVDHEWRWKDLDRLLARSRRDFRQPLWLGEQDLAGKTILLHAEQGLGDTLQFCRYARSVAQLGARVILEVPAPLVRLMSSLEGVSEVLTQGRGVLPEFDYHCPLMSLPLAFKTTLETIPSQVPYLKSDPLIASEWNKKLGPRRKPRVGLVWSGGLRPSQPELWSVNRRRNITLEKLAVLGDEEVEYYSLQKGEPGESELSQLVASGWQGPVLVDYTRELGDFADTAGLIEQLDLVIAVDTSVAHLAGAMGKAVWVMNRYDSCWRWLLGREDTPWYPSMRLYRQERPGEWESVVQRIRADLATIRVSGAAGTR